MYFLLPITKNGNSTKNTYPPIHVHAPALDPPAEILTFSTICPIIKV